MSSRSSASVSKPAASAANSSSSSGRRLALTSLTVTSNTAVLPPRPRRVFLGERDLDVALVAGGGADQLLLESRDKPARAELDQLVAALAALERLAVDRADVVDDDVVAGLRRAARRSRASRAGRAGRRSPGRSARRRRAGSRRPTSRPLYWPSFARRADADLDRELERLALAGEVADVEVGLADRRRCRPRRSRRRTSSPSAVRSASSSTASRPRRRMTTGGGTLPLRKPGTRIWRPSSRAACWMRRSTSSAGTSACDANARLGQLGDAGLDGLMITGR